MNKHDLIQKVKALDGISQDERAYLIDLINTKKKYGLVWEDKPEDVEETLRTHLPVLQEVKEKRITGFKDLQDRQDLKIGQDRQGSKQSSTPSLFDSILEAAQDANNQSNNPAHLDQSLNPVKDCFPNHTLIEGDNLHALTALTFTHENNIDVIYIDPPYNTGNKDFKYNDSFVDREDSYRHSKWLSFMDKRLRIAKRLLSDKGVIFISIDDNEQAQLKMLCDEVFGEENFLVNFAWEKRYSPPPDTKDIGYTHESILMYRKTQNFERNLLPKTDAQLDRYKNPDNDLRGVWKAMDYTCRYTKEERPNLYYGIQQPNTSKTIFPKETRVWAFSFDEHLKNEEENSIWWGVDGKNSVPAKKNFLNTTSSGAMPVSLLKHEQVGHTDESQKELRAVLSNIKFTPKPTRLIKHFLQISSHKSATILDFFAGSGTTLHSTMALNAEDGGRRQCILVTNNENNICEEITYERNKRVIEGYYKGGSPSLTGEGRGGVFVEGLSGNNLRYYKTATVEREPSLRNKRQLTRLATELLCIKEDCYTPRATTDTALQAFEEQTKRLLLVYDDAMIDEALAYLKTWLSESPAESPIKVYVFSNGQYPYTEDFEEVLPHITLCALPDAIYKAYQYVLPKREKTKPEQDLGMGQDGQDFLQD